MDNRPLFTRPEEIILIIVSHIDERRDLLSLALTSRVFGRIITPLLDVIHIRCDPRRTDLWLWLAANPHLAARTQTLELFDEVGGLGQTDNEGIIPSSFLRDFSVGSSCESYEGCVLLLAKAVVLMTRLRRFQWKAELPIAYAFKDLYVSLSQLNNIDEFEFDFLLESLNETLLFDDVRLPAFSPLRNLQGITRLCLNVWDLPWRSDETKIVQKWMMQLTKLKHLKLFMYDDFDFGVICKYARWPSLVELSLEGHIQVLPQLTDNDPDYPTSVQGQLGIFLRNHLTLERVETSRLYLPPQTYPRLCTLILGSGSPYDLPLGNWFPLEIAQKIQHLDCPISMRSLPILRGMTSLHTFRAINMELKIFQRVVEVVPRIRELDIPYMDWSRRYNVILGAHKFADTVVSSLFKLKDLVKLEGGFISDDGKDLLGNEYIITRIMKHERLEYIDSVTREEVDSLLSRPGSE